MRFPLYLTCLLFVQVLCFSTYSYCQTNYIQPQTAQALKQFLLRTSDRIPIVAAHRGGAVTGFPENCIATFEHTLQFTPALIECDVQFTKDSVLVMMHDEKLERTSTGTGKLQEKSWADLKKIHLKDNSGTITPYTIPSLEQVLVWAKAKTVVQLDPKKGVPPHTIVKAIQQNNAQAYSIVITYSIESAIQYYQLDSSLVISITVRNFDELERFTRSGIPSKNVVAFVGITEPDPALYEALHQRGISCILGTMGNLDRKAQASQNNVYTQLIINGADILSTDMPKEAAEAIQELIPDKSSKKIFYAE